MYKPTRGYGLLEALLAYKRAKIATQLIPYHYKRGRILDIGCGTYPYFLSHVGFKERYGLDKFVIPSCKDVRLIQQNIEVKPHLPFEDAFFDVITMLGVLEHIGGENIDSLCREVYRVLKQNGLLIITSPHRWTDKVLKIMAKIGLVSWEEISEHKVLYTPHQICKILVRNGFSKEKIFFGYFELRANIWVRCEK